MFDIGASELLLIVVVAVVVIGPKDLPLALRTAGKWMAKVRRVSGHFRAGLDTMIREAELEEMEREWKQRNEAIMKAHPDAGDMQAVSGVSAEAAVAPATPVEPQTPPPPP
jgi:sec-independent protein translocase protein TatB